MAVQYWIRLGRRTEGPFPLEEVRQRARRGALTPAHSVSRDGRQWMAALRCRDVFAEDGSVAAAAASLSLEQDSAPDEDVGSLADALAPDVPAPAAVERPAAPAIWPASAACAATLCVAVGLPLARDAQGLLWWWDVVALADLGGAALAIAAVCWALVSVAAIAMGILSWMAPGHGRSLLLAGASFASIGLATLAWALGMAGGAWTIPACLAIPASAWALRASADASRPAGTLPQGHLHTLPVELLVAVVLGILCILPTFAAPFVREGAAALMAGLLSLGAGAALVATGIRWRVAGPDEWTTAGPVGAAAIACAAILCDGISALQATPLPPTSGTRMAALDAVRVIAVIVAQCALAYLAAQEAVSRPSARPAQGTHTA